MYSTRSYLTAGVAVVGASALALTPVAPMAHDMALAPREVSALAVALAANQGTINPIALWVDTLNTAANNALALFTAFSANPFPILSQMGANLLTYLGELPDFGLIIQQVFANIGNALQAPFTADPLNISEVPFQTIPLPPPLPSVELNQQLVYSLLPQVLPADTYAAIEPILNFTTTPISGALIGLANLLIAPGLALSTGISTIIGALTTADFGTAINELINLPAYVVGAFLNGGEFLDLVPVLGLLGIQLPTEITSFGLNIGGLLSPGGVGFDSVSAEGTFAILPAPLPPVSLVDPGFPLGPIGALGTVSNAIAEAIAVTPPSAAAEDPEVSADAASDAGSADADTAAADAPQAGADRSDAAASGKREQRRGSRGAASDTADSADSGSAGKSDARASAARRAS